MSKLKIILEHAVTLIYRCLSIILQVIQSSSELALRLRIHHTFKKFSLAMIEMGTPRRCFSILFQNKTLQEKTVSYSMCQVWAAASWRTLAERVLEGKKTDDKNWPCFWFSARTSLKGPTGWLWLTLTSAVHTSGRAGADHCERPVTTILLGVVHTSTYIRRESLRGNCFLTRPACGNAPWTIAPQ